MLILVLLVVGALHAAYFYANDKEMHPDAWLLCYGLNFLMALIIYATMLELARRQSPYLGFFFLFGSVFKFVVYFMIIDPLLRRDGGLSYADFFLFFIPYLTGLLVETLAVIKLLKKGTSGPLP